MAEYDASKTTTTNLTGTVTDYSVASQSLDAAQGNDETYWYFTKAAQNFGYYKTIPELNASIKALAIWTAGKGYNCDTRTKVILDYLKGWGEDSFQALMQNMIIVKKIVGDSFAEIIRDEDSGRLINLKPISPERMKIVTNSKGIIIRYEQNTKQGWEKYQPEEILHLSNDRIGDEIHGNSVIEACEWVILALHEAMDTYRKILKRSLAMGILYLDTNDAVKIAQITAKYQEAVNKGEVLVMPMGVAKLEDSKITVQDFLSWIQDLRNVFYQVVGVPKVIATSEGLSEAGGKVGFITFEPVYTNEQSLLEQDLWKQLALKVIFNRPPSLMDSMQSSEEKNTGQTSIQPKEAGINMQRE